MCLAKQKQNKINQKYGGGGGGTLCMTLYIHSGQPTFL